MATFTWTGGTLGSWTDPSAWSGPGGAPTATDVAIIPGAPGPAVYEDVINGPGTAATLITTTGGVLLNGAFSFQDVEINDTGRFYIGSGTTLDSQSLTENHGGQIFVNGGTVSIDGTLTTDSLAVFRNGAVIRADSYVAGGGNVTLDATSSLNIGSSGSATPGILTVDAGHSLIDDQPFGYATLVANGLLNEGTILGSSGILTPRVPARSFSSTAAPTMVCCRMSHCAAAPRQAAAQSTGSPTPGRSSGAY